VDCAAREDGAEAAQNTLKSDCDCFAVTTSKQWGIKCLQVPMVRIEFALGEVMTIHL
jgi:hypothetical protein